MAVAKMKAEDVAKKGVVAVDEAVAAEGERSSCHKEFSPKDHSLWREQVHFFLISNRSISNKGWTDLNIKQLEDSIELL